MGCKGVSEKGAYAGLIRGYVLGGFVVFDTHRSLFHPPGRGEHKTLILYVKFCTVVYCTRCVPIQYNTDAPGTHPPNPHPLINPRPLPRNPFVSLGTTSVLVKYTCSIYIYNFVSFSWID